MFKYSKYWNNFLTFMAIASVFLIYVLFFNRNRTTYSVSSKYTAQSNICSKHQGKLVLLNDTNISFPRCIDGSLPGYYIRNGYGEGKLKWAVYFEGGGWCYDLEVINTINVILFESTYFSAYCALIYRLAILEGKQIWGVLESMNVALDRRICSFM